MHCLPVWWIRMLGSVLATFSKPDSVGGLPWERTAFVF